MNTPPVPHEVVCNAVGVDRRYIVAIQNYLNKHGDPSVEFVTGLLPDIGIPVKIYRDLVEATSLSFTTPNHQGISAP